LNSTLTFACIERPSFAAAAAAETSGVDVLCLPSASGGECGGPTLVTKLVMRGGAAAAEDGTSTVAHEKGAGAVMALSFVPRRGGDDSDDARPPLLLAAYEEGTVALWDPNRRAAANEENEDESPLWRDRVHEDAATCVAADADGAGFVTGGADGRVCAFSLAFDAAATTTTPTATVTMRHAHGPYTPSANVADRARWGGRAAGAGVSDVAIRGDGKLVAAACWCVLYTGPHTTALAW